MYTLARGAVHGAAFGLAVAAVDVWADAAEAVHHATVPPAASLVQGAAHTVLLGALAGTLCAYLLQDRGGGLERHRLATAVVFTLYVALTTAGGPTALTIAAPLLALVLVPLARFAAFRWRWDPVLLGLLAVALGILFPHLYAR